MSEWYYAVDDKRHGPLSSKELKALVEKGTLARSNLVWKEGTPDWVPAHTLKGLFPEASVNQVASQASAGTKMQSPPADSTSVTVPVTPWIPRLKQALEEVLNIAVGLVLLVCRALWIVYWVFVVPGAVCFGVYYVIEHSEVLDDPFFYFVLSQAIIISLLVGISGKLGKIAAAISQSKPPSSP